MRRENRKGRFLTQTHICPIPAKGQTAITDKPASQHTYQRFMDKNLVIVESPAKAKTIEKFLGKDYHVMSSFGHIRDLKEREFGIDVEHQFKPDYVVPDDKKKLVSELKKAANGAETVWLASDEDREGEAIAWHLYEELKLKPEKTRRIVFHEITKTAILNAIANPRNIDINLVNAQQARRVLDRIVGFELSPVLWRKIKPSLSAGRVQSVTVRLVVEREREINNFKAEASFRVSAIFTATDTNGENTSFSAVLKNRFTEEKDALAFLEHCKNTTFTIEDIETHPTRKSPAAPFTTSTLQQEASRKFGFPVSVTMRVAQSLYESGKITYMRTDSVNLSDLALATSKAEIEAMSGKEYHKMRRNHTKSKGAQEAHEAIRPTYMNQHSIEGTAQEKRLYDLIWKRTIASQMADAELEKTTITIAVGGSREQFIATGEVMKFDGFLKVYMESSDDENDSEQEGILPKLAKGQQITQEQIVAQQRFSQHPPRYTEASLVRKLEELGIGRPSTYAPTISTILNREYVEKKEITNEAHDYRILTLKNGTIKAATQTEKPTVEKGKLTPTDIGIVVNDFLCENFPRIMDYNFTAKEEEQFDEIAAGKELWTKNIEEFYNDFHPTVETVAKSTGKKAGERLLGTDPASGKPVFAKIGRYGAIVQIGEASDTDKPRFASLRTGQTLESITLEEALELFKLPLYLGEYEGEKVTVAVGRFGPYVRHGNSYTSVPKGEDPLSVTLERAIEIIEAKRREDKNKEIKKFEAEDIQVLNGRYGAYIAHAGTNYKIPKGNDPAALTLADCQKIIAEAKTKPASATKKRTARKK